MHDGSSISVYDKLYSTMNVWWLLITEAETIMNIYKELFQSNRYTIAKKSSKSTAIITSLTTAS